MKDLLKRAMEIAAKQQDDQSGAEIEPRIQRPTAIVDMLKSTNEKTVAYLHDVCEEGYTSIDDLRTQGFPKKITNALDAIIPRDGESYNDYVLRVRKNKLACAVKLADLTYSGDLSRLENPTGRDFKRAKDYTTMNRDLLELKHHRELDSPFDTTGNVERIQGKKGGEENINQFGNTGN